MSIVINEPVRFVHITRICQTCFWGFTEEVDLKNDLIQIDRKLKVVTKCQTCNHEELSHDYRPSNLPISWGEIIYSYPLGKWIGEKFGIKIYVGAIGDGDNYYWSQEIERFKHHECSECGCAEFVPSDEYMAWMLEQNECNGMRYPNINEWKSVERVRRFLFDTHKQKPLKPPKIIHHCNCCKQQDR